MTPWQFWLFLFVVSLGVHNLYRIVAALEKDKGFAIPKDFDPGCGHVKCRGSRVCVEPSPTFALDPKKGGGVT